MSSRAYGILLHPTSLPGPHGIGDLGPAAHTFVDWLAAAGARYWQVLPLVPTGLGSSPYGGTAAFAGNPLLISPQQLVRDGLLPAAALAETPRFPVTRIDWGRAIPWKESLLARAFAHVRANRPEVVAEALAWGREPSRRWVADWALFSALKEHYGGGHWAGWPAPLRDRDPAALASAERDLAELVTRHVFVQWVFERQWQELRSHARERGVGILGDLPIYVADDCVDVWVDRDLFTLDAEGRPTTIAGVPPDYFSRTGQRWGNPLYRWERHLETGFAWWIARVRRNLELADLVRCDHFRGFAGFWELPADAPDGRPGRWVKAPGRELFAALREALGALPLVAEDLGVITPDVVALRREFGLAGMKVLQFAYGAIDSDHAPHRHTADSVAYTGTHDNDTTRGWFEKAGPAERRRALAYLGCSAHDVVWAQMRACLQSVAELAIVPFQDVLELGSEGRMNTPSSAFGNWGWRSRSAALTRERAERLRELAALAGRLRGQGEAECAAPDGYPAG
jgi:4-alpha-glucanotransferase